MAREAAGANVPAAIWTEQGRSKMVKLSQTNRWGLWACSKALEAQQQGSSIQAKDEKMAANFSRHLEWDASIIVCQTKASLSEDAS